MEIASAQLIWTAICAFLVSLMQIGFGLLEVGSSRSKNSLNTAIKNISDFALAGILFWLVGFGLMYGPSWYGLSGFGDFAIGIDREIQTASV